MSVLSLLPVIEGGRDGSTGDMTWKLEDGGASRKIGGEEALCQAIRLMLEVPRYRYPIYSWQYGSELETLIGKGIEEVRARAPRMIREALLTDDRITDVDGFTIEKGSQPGSADISFTVYAGDKRIAANWTVG